MMVKVLVTQLCLTVCDPRDCSPPGSFVHEILQARILEWVANSFSWGSSQLRDQTQVSCTAGRFFTPSAMWEAHFYFLYVSLICPISFLLFPSDILHILFQLVSGKGHIFFSSFRLVESIRNIFLCFELVLSMEIVSY